MAGHSKTLPFASKREPWHGQTHVPLGIVPFHCTTEEVRTGQVDDMALVIQISINALGLPINLQDSSFV